MGQFRPEVQELLQALKQTYFEQNDTFEKMCLGTPVLLNNQQNECSPSQ